MSELENETISEDANMNPQSAGNSNNEASVSEKPASFKWLVALVALFSVCVTLLVVVGVVRNRQRANQNQVDQGQSPGGALVSATPIDLSQFAPISSFDLTDHQGQAFSSQGLKGKWWLASFIFTNCPQVCPDLTLQKADLRLQLEKKYELDLRYISFSVDPVNDTPEKLSAFAKKLNASHDDWRFLTGAREKIWSLCQRDFHLPVSNSDDPDVIITHSTRIVLVDPDGKIRGYYDPKKQESKAQLFSFLDERLKDKAALSIPAQ